MSVPSLGIAVGEFITEYLSENGGGFPLSLVIGINFVNSEGKQMTLVDTMDDQSITTSMGLSSYLEEWFKDDARAHWQATVWSTEEDE